MIDANKTAFQVLDPTSLSSDVNRLGLAKGQYRAMLDEPTRAA